MSARFASLVAPIAIAGTLFAAPAMAESLVVSVDRATIMRLDQPAATIIIGNPAIADASVQNREMLIVTGKAYGSTNLIVLDGQGQVISESTIYVQAVQDGAVTVQRGMDKVSLACTPNCERVLAIGDSSDAFSAVGSQMETRNRIATGAEAPAGNN
ncbi:MAG: pilus assembly protein N-terminal domain-containing protein [Rhodobiaceae bacterium]|nr:pilus assembly protein N-terminal domain-containing protein [Rhodobiaceae bacterium]MCC0055145.1 pilus assembly protein N-terminal domain-containing protein [Rhodobiaceae bacterium]